MGTPAAGGRAFQAGRQACGRADRRADGRTGGRRPQGVRSLSQKVFIRSLSNLVNMLVGIISISAITSQTPKALLNEGP